MTTMSKSSFSVREDPDGIVVGVLTGFLTLGEAESYAGETFAAADAARKRWGVLRLLLDATGSTTQSTEMVATMREAAARVLSDPGDRMAIALTSGLLKLQAKRVIDHAGLGFFETAADARAWLLAPGPDVSR